MKQMKQYLDNARGQALFSVFLHILILLMVHCPVTATEAPGGEVTRPSPQS